MLRITILGTGYVGLVSGVFLSDMGHHVTCIDKDQKKISLLQNKKPPIYENGLEELLKINIECNRLTFSTKLTDSLNSSDVVIVAVGTPIADEKTGNVNLSYVNACVSEIANHLKKDILVIIKSTVPVGTCDRIQEQLDKLSDFKCVVVSSPEFLREGNAVEDFMNPDRIIIGSNGQGNEVIKQLFSKFIRYGKRFIFCNRRTAELIKYASNAFLAMKVSFINEIADISTEVGADMKKLSLGIGSDKRIGFQFLNPGPGFGGSCFPKDVKALENIMTTHNITGELIKSIAKSNTNRFKKIATNIIHNTKKGAIITILGLTYKAGTDDVRDSPSIEIIKHLLLNNSYKIKVWDPCGMSNAQKILEHQVEYYNTIDDACMNSSLIVVATEWQVFKTIDPIKLKKLVKNCHIYDLRNIINRENFLKNGFNVTSIGYTPHVSQLCPS
ncbi:MAG: UDP-glucose/GDP-mannose dehydrogenase family protein [Rickettsiales bacterium]|nr:UDP-glucose/GDP-mannose dehydrogenase family protein [Rickettsiales bacterium]